jgi:hypothetical protein
MCQLRLDLIAGETMVTLSNRYRVAISTLLAVLIVIPGSSLGFSGGIGGTQDNSGDEISDVAEQGCLCHNGDGPTNSVTVLMDKVPYTYIPGQTYEMKLQIIGGPTKEGHNTGGFSMRVDFGSLAAGAGSEADIHEAVEGDSQTLTHTTDGAQTSDMAWMISWTAPEAGNGIVIFRISGNSVNGDNAQSDADNWNHLMFSLPEETRESADERVRTIFVGDGNIEPPAAEKHGVSLHDMGAPLRAHWLGLLGFLSVILVIVFCGFMLRYGFSTSYEGRSNLLRLRYHVNRRGDQ